MVIAAVDFFTKHPDSTIAATEHGYLGAAVPDLRIVDLTGLHERRLARKQLPVAELLAREQPDFIWMPPSSYHELYVKTRQFVATNSCYQFDEEFLLLGFAQKKHAK